MVFTTDLSHDSAFQRTALDDFLDDSVEYRIYITLFNLS